VSSSAYFGVGADRDQLREIAESAPERPSWSYENNQEAEMYGTNPSKREVLNLMRRLGLSDLIEQAERELPDPVDLTRDGDLLARFGLGLDAAVDRLGGSSW
jgi:hypothetical protein